MDADEQQQHRPNFVLRQALVAIIAAMVAIGAISVVSDRDDPEVPPVDMSGITAAAVTEAPVTGSGVIDSPVTDGAVIVPLDTAPVTAPGTAVDTAPPAADAPDIAATAYAVYDVSSGEWLAEREANTPVPVGSVMKLLTTYVVLQAGDLAKVVTVPDLDVDISESAIGLYAGEQLPRDVLLRAMLIVSANDAARTLAIDVGGSTEGFVQQMNAAAAQLGLTETVAANPIGLDAQGAHSSAHDMIELATLLMQDQTFREAVAKPSASLHGQTFAATNKLLTTYDGATGVKTGHTTGAGWCLVGSATRDGRSVIVAVLGAPTEEQRLTGATTLLDWAFAQP